MLDDGSITVDCPVDKIPEKGYFTLIDGSLAANGMSHPLFYCVSLYLMCVLHAIHPFTFLGTLPTKACKVSKFGCSYWSIHRKAWLRAYPLVVYSMKSAMHLQL